MTPLPIDLCAVTFLAKSERFLPTIQDAAVRRSQMPGVDGDGLFTLRDRQAGEVLGALDGQEVDPRLHPGVMEHLEWNALSPTCLLVRAIRTSYGFINHSLAPNVSVDAQGRVMRLICSLRAGEEFSMDYFAQPVPGAYLETAEARRLRRAPL